MQPERWRQIEQLFHSALQLEGGSRAAFLERSCQGDPELRASIDSLLAVHEAAGDFLESPALEVAASSLSPSSEGDAEPADPAYSLIGSVVSHYHVIEELGHGGMGIVYKAQDDSLGRFVALKFVPDELAGDPHSLERLRREARAASGLNHPHICTIYEIGEDGAKRFIAMEYVEGQTLTRLSMGRPLQTEILLQVAADVADALEAAHAKGIIHRDIKPANILVTARGRAKVLDFGIAKFLGPSGSGAPEVSYPSAAVPSSGPDTAVGIAVGTVAYMSPEQVLAKDLDARTDLFSLGVVLYEMATGRLPFAGEGSSVICHAILKLTQVPATQLNPRTPLKLQDIIDKCLEKDRELRYQSASDIRADLQRLTRDTQSQDAVAAIRPRKNWRLLAALAVALLAAAGAGLFHYLTRASKLTDKDTIVLADFTNSTGDAVLDGTLRQGLSVQLEQSPFLSVISDAQIQQTLQMMSQKPDTRLTPEIARELCQRTGSVAVLDGSITRIGAPYLLTVKAVNCASGETLASAKAQASDKSHVLDALETTGAEIRSKLGESLGTSREFATPLEQATTPSLEALKAFSSGFKVQNTVGSAAAIPFYEQAIELDPNFALAYAWLGVAFNDIGEFSTDVTYTRRAYELRERTSGPERYFITARFHKVVTGNMEKAEQALQLWIRAYPRSPLPHIYLAGAIYPVKGQYEKGVEAGREAVRLSPDFSTSYALPMLNYIALNRLDEAKASYKQAIDRKLKNSFFALALYQIAFLQNDAAGMAQQVSRSAGEPGIEATLLANEADTAAYSGRLKEARELSRLAVDAAERAGEHEAAATYSALSDLRDALFGNADEARRRASLAIQHLGGHDAQYASALALAYAGDGRLAQVLAADLGRRFSEATIVQFNFLPTIRGKLAVKKGDASEAIESLRGATSYELGVTTYSACTWTGMYPVYVRGEAYLAAHRGSDATVEFQKILDHRGIVLNEPIGALARLQLGRAYVMLGETAKARAAYEDFLTLWKDADPDIPILKQAKVEYGKLQ